MATVTMNTEAAIVVVYDYCFEGRWDQNDNQHSCPEPCGQINYIDVNGDLETISGISVQSGIISISAQSIVSTTGVNTVSCIPE